jgi:elongation factor P
MGTTRNLSKGITIKLNDNLFTVIDYAHVKMGRGGAIVRIRLRNVETGAVIDKTVNAGATLDIVRMEEKAMQYIYKEGDLYYFMDQETYEQESLPEKLVADATKYLKESDIVHFLTAEDKVIGVKLPMFCELKVVETEPPMKGAKASGGLKPAVLETGTAIQVPLFLTPGETVKVDTRTGNYVERVK